MKANVWSLAQQYATVFGKAAFIRFVAKRILQLGNQRLLLIFSASTKKVFEIVLADFENNIFKNIRKQKTSPGFLCVFMHMCVCVFPLFFHALQVV